MVLVLKSRPNKPEYEIYLKYCPETENSNSKLIFNRVKLKS